MGFFDFLKKLLGGDAGDSADNGQPSRAPRSSRPSQSRPTPPPPAVGGSWPKGGASTPIAPIPPKRLDLDLARFTPLSDEEMKRQAKGVRFSWTMWNRRDRIPSADDARANLIERGMVGQGLITPEQLAEMHEVGTEYDRLSPLLEHAYRAGTDAVRNERLAKEELKAAKKKEAAERKAARRAAIEKRKATDILFLGRGVSRGLSDHRANVERLEAAGLPILTSPASVAESMDLPIPKLRWLAFHSEAVRHGHYVRFTIPKKSGGVRELWAPYPDIAAAQRWIFTEILAKLPVHPAAHGFVTARSTVSNATPHVGHDVVVNCDLRDFFPTITYARVRGYFAKLGYSPAAATILALLCTESPRQVLSYCGETWLAATGPRALPQGACTSPALSNLIAGHLDLRLQGMADKLEWTYTRYADDLSFSASGEAAKKTGYVLARVRHICQDEGFAVNEKKTRVQRQNMQQSVTGIVVNERPNIDRKTIRRLRAILHAARSTGLEAQNREGHPHFAGWVRGMIAYVHMVNPEKATELWADLEKVRER